eukprot:c36728_g1_i1.p1 GENE.c36728_g1_i1~~c36728_g1_i1.p1  ORF type:complete len:151 (-),score=45.40 c36728_g1_i1:214-642(-)
MSRFHFILLVCVALLISTSVQGFCTNSFRNVDCSGENTSNFDKFCRKDTEKGQKYFCLKCHPEWFVSCDCSDCSVHMTTIGVAVVVSAALTGVVLIVSGVLCCCCRFSGCPMYNSKPRPDLQTPFLTPVRIVSAVPFRPEEK